MVTQNLIIWWIDAAGILHTCSQISSPPSTAIAQGLYAQGNFNPTLRSGSVTHFQGKPASIGTTPRGLFDALDNRFPHTRWWIPTQSTTQTPTNPSPPDNRPVTAHS